MIVDTDDFRDHHVERFRCPGCGKLKIYSFTRRKNTLEYPCDAFCEVCGMKYKAIDANFRCQLCSKRVDCFVSFPIVMEEKGPYTPPRLSRVRKSHKR